MHEISLQMLTLPSKLRDLYEQNYKHLKERWSDFKNVQSEAFM